MFTQAIKPISYVKAHAAEIIRETAETGNPLVITQNGEAKAVLIDVSEYDAMRENLTMPKILVVSAREVKQDKTRDADDVFADMDTKLATKRHTDEILRKRLLSEDVPDGNDFDKKVDSL